MTGPSSGDRPAEEPRSICGVEHEDTEGYWTCTLAAGHRSPHGAFDYETQDLLAAWPATPPAVRTGDEWAAERARQLQERFAQAAYRNGFRDGQRAASSTPPPVSGTATRDDVARELRRHSASARLVDNGSTYITCRCGFAIGSYLHGWGDPASHDAWELHRADVLLALGGSQPAAESADEAAVDRFMSSYLDDVGAFDSSNDEQRDRDNVRAGLIRLIELHAAQPVQPAEEERPIDRLTDQGDEGLRGRVAKIRELTELSRDHGIRSVAVDELLLILDGGDRG